MKRWGFALALFLAAVAVPSQELRSLARLDWMLTLRGGVEWQFGRVVGVRAGLGTNTRLLAADAGLQFDLAPDALRFRWKIVIGVPNAAMPFTPAGIISLGGSMIFGVRFESGVSLDFRIGSGYPLFFESGESMFRDTSFPLGLWPDLAVTLGFQARRSTVRR
jgi:hypothetical protein